MYPNRAPSQIRPATIERRFPLMKTRKLVISQVLLTCFACALTVGASRDDSRALTAADTDTSSNVENDRVDVNSITVLVFSENKRARSRHELGGQELRCVGGSASGFWWFFDYYPHQVQCKNVGWDGTSIQWACVASLPDFIEFGPDTSVICEPYDAANNDGYILRGSCRLEYTLNFTTFRFTSVHIVYGCVLILFLLWFYYQTRYWVYRHLKRLAAEQLAARRARRPSYL